MNLPILNPLPQRYITIEPGIGGAIKQRDEDFIVDELPLYDPCGEGEHLYLGIQKSGVAHAELMAVLRRHFGVTDRAIGYAGMKDKHGVTRQAVSIHLPHGDPPNAAELPHERISIMWAMRHRNKIRRGHLAGNRFSIRIRDVEPTQAPQVLRTIRRLQDTGVPAYFGPQRFGYRHHNHLLGALLLTGQWDAVVHEIVGTGHTPFPPYQQQRRELADRGAYAEALDQWTTADRTERQMLRALVRGADAKGAALALDRNVRAFFINALQSAIFNRVLDERIDRGLLTELVLGDLAWKHDTRNVFPVTQAELDSGELPSRVQRHEVSPSGPLWGQSRWSTAADVARMEQQAFDSFGLTSAQFDDSPVAPEGDRRPLRVPLTNADVEGGVDEHGGYIRVMFDLPRGSYATVVLRELMKNDASDALELDASSALQDAAG